MMECPSKSIACSIKMAKHLWDQFKAFVVAEADPDIRSRVLEDYEDQRLRRSSTRGVVDVDGYSLIVKNNVKFARVCRGNAGYHLRCAGVQNVG